jgi:hypothetical protein
MLLSSESSLLRELRSSPDVYPALALFTRESLLQLSRELARWHFSPTFQTNWNMLKAPHIEELFVFGSE